MTALPLVWRDLIPSHWQWTKLRYVARIGTGHTPDRTKPEYWLDCDIPWVTAADLSQRPRAFQPLFDTEQKVSALGVANSAAVVHPAGTVMLCRTASVGLFCVTGSEMATTQAFVTWTPSPGLDSRFLLYLVAALRPEIDRLAYGSTHLTVYMPDLEALEVPVPPLDEQRRIADFLDAEVTRIDTILESRRLQERLVWQSAYSWVYEHVLQGEPTILRRLIATESLGTWGVEPSESTPTLVARVADFDRETFTLGPVETLRGVEERSRASKGLLPGDTLLERSGGTQKNPVGCAVYVADVDEVTVCSNFVSRVRPVEGVNPRYLSLVLAALYTNGEQRSHSNQTTGIQNLDTQSYFGMKVPILTRPQQRDVAAMSDKVLENARTLSRTVARSVSVIEEFKRSLITAAVTGELDVTTAGSGVPA